MSDEFSQAAREAVEAADNAEQLRLIAAVLKAQQLTQQQPCQHHHPPKPEFSAKKWLVIGGVACVCSLAFALASIAIAIGACCATGCFLILRSIWTDYRKGH